MKFFGHPTAKPTVVLSNTPQIGFLSHRPLKKAELKSDVKTTIQGVRKSDGKKTYKGSAALKGTQLLASFMHAHVLGRRCAHTAFAS